MQVHDDTSIVLQLLLIIGVAHKRQHQSFNTDCRLYAIGQIFFIRCRIQIFQRFLTCFLMLLQIIIGSVRNSPQLTPTNLGMEIILDIAGTL